MRGLLAVFLTMFAAAGLAAKENRASWLVHGSAAPTPVLFAAPLNTAQDVPKRPIRLNDLQQDNVPGLKSPSTALLLSLVVPGTGHLYAGANRRYRVFFSTEAAGWLALGAFTVWQHQKENEFRGWAADHAGVGPEGKPDDFWQAMTYYASREDYEIYGRADEPERPSYPDLAGWDWRWDADGSRQQYRQLRNSAKEADRRATFSLGALVLNRIVAAIDAFRSARAFNQRRGQDLTSTRLRIKGTPFGTNQNVFLVFERVF